MPASSAFQLRAQSAVASSTMLNSGTASIGSRAHGFPARVDQSTVTGGDFTVALVTVTPSSGTVAALATLQLTAVPTIASGDKTADAVTWASDDVTKATVGATTGLVTGVAAGTANITATSLGTDSAAVVITVPA